MAAAGAELGLPAAQVLLSSQRSAVVARRQDIAQLRQLLSTAMKELSAVEYDVAVSKGSTLGAGAHAGLGGLAGGGAGPPRGRICEDMPAATLQTYARQAQALKAQVAADEGADAAVGLQALREHVERHGPLVDRPYSSLHAPCRHRRDCCPPHRRARTAPQYSERPHQVWAGT